MTTTIAPSIGTAPSFLHLGPGAADLYGAIDMRRFMGSGMQEGALSSATTSGSYKVSAGAGMTVNIAADVGEGVLVRGDSITVQGLYYVPPTSAAIVEAIGAAHATLPRIDLVVVEVLDAFHDGGASNVVRTRVVPGVATSGATLDNRNGAPAQPISALLCADVLVPAASASILAANIRDRRPRATGLYRFIQRNTNASAGSHYTATTAYLTIDATNLRARVECTGNPLELELIGRWSGPALGAVCSARPEMDGAAITGMSGDTFAFIVDTSAIDMGFVYRMPLAPTVGSHTFSWQFKSTTAGALLNATSVLPLTMIVREIVQSNSDNT